MVGSKASPRTGTVESPSQPAGVTIPWNFVKEPGAYVCNETGRLFRVPPAALLEGHSPIISIAGPGGEDYVTYLSSNPYTPIDKLRQVCADMNISPQF